MCLEGSEKFGMESPAVLSSSPSGETVIAVTTAMTMTAPTTPNSTDTTTSANDPLPEMPSLSNLSAGPATCTTKFCSEEVDSYAQFQQTYRPFESSNQVETEEEEEEEEDSNSSSTAWDLFLSLYLASFILGLRRSMFVTANLFRSLLLGHFLRLVVASLPAWAEQHTWLSPWLQAGASCNVSSTANSGKMDPHAWPPPALTALAILTVFALVVHPDGFTWIMLGKLRSVYSFTFPYPYSLTCKLL